MLLRRSSIISSLASEAYIMLTANKTDEWLKSKTEIERKELHKMVNLIYMHISEA
jgi:hypothetical protein